MIYSLFMINVSQSTGLGGVFGPSIRVLKCVLVLDKGGRGALSWRIRGGREKYEYGYDKRLDGREGHGI